MKAAMQKIPEWLIYEMVDGRPVYYKGYQAFLSGEKPTEALKGSSYLQSLIATELVILLSRLIDLGKYRIMSNEIGLKYGKKNWRAADIAIYKKEVLKDIPVNNKSLEVAPEIVIEIDTKADLESDAGMPGYYHQKTDQLLQFGVKKVIWIFTDSEKVMVASGPENWKTSSWKTDVEIMDGVQINISKIVAAQ